MDLSVLIHTYHLTGVAYVVLFLGMLFEATFFLFSAAILLAEHALNPAMVVFLVTTGAFAEEVIWYFIGVKLGKWERIAAWTDRLAKPVDKHLIDKTFHTLMISKFVYGAHRAILTRAGMLGMPLKRFMRNAFSSTFIWLAVLGSAGYFVGTSGHALRRYINFAQIIPLVIIVAYFVIEYFVSRRLRRSL